jgi:hypothetical protein
MFSLQDAQLIYFHSMHSGSRMVGFLAHMESYSFGFPQKIELRYQIPTVALSPPLSDVPSWISSISSVVLNGWTAWRQCNNVFAESHVHNNRVSKHMSYIYTPDSATSTLIYFGNF